ncbi:MAG: hypothetical protein JRJ41_07060 [Deltaproteobacteria bacterium]|jgi:hypothetical protein|nr:hypothetical protein [Deltaproteobacteria bacterium]
MNKKQFLISLACVCFFSFLGGIVSSLFNFNDIFAENKFIEVEEISTRLITITNNQGKKVARFSYDGSGNPYLTFYSNKKPLKRIYHKFDVSEMTSKDGETHFIKDKYTKPIFGVHLKNEEPAMFFNDRDLDKRIGLGITNLEPGLDVLYRNKTRLILGTNHLINKETGNKEKLEGSICFYDNTNKLLGILP